MDHAQAGTPAPFRAAPRSPGQKPAVTVASFQAPVIRDVDVLVVGGGPAGVGAAIRASREGMTVLLAEHYGFLGGAHGYGEIGTFAGLYLSDPAEDVPSFIGKGINRDVVGALRGLTSGARPQVALTGPQRWFDTYIEVYDPFWLRIVLDRLVRGAGVETLFHATALQPLLSGDRIEGALLATKAGPVAVRARVTIDATGDADLVARAGGHFRMGENGALQHPTLLFRMMGVDTERLRFHSWREIAELMREYGEAYGLNRFFPGVFLGTREGEVLLNVTKQVRPDGGALDMLDPFDRSFAEMEGREACVRYERFFRERVPGFEKARINYAAAGVAVRETRLVDGLSRLTGEQVLGAAKFDDGIAYSAWPMERMEGDTVELSWLPPKAWYEVPYGCLVPDGLDGLLVAGRCLSAERAAHASARTWALCLDLGEAAGLAAATALLRGLSPAEIEGASLRQALGGLLLEPERSPAPRAPALT
jgi:glycine/D-amino acid oxidase-like deaminating enzyme